MVVAEETSVREISAEMEGGDAEEETEQCLIRFAVNAEMTVKFHSDLQEENPCIAVPVLKKWEIRGLTRTDQADFLIDQMKDRSLLIQTKVSSMLSIKNLTES